MCSFVIKIGILVNEAVLDDMIIPAPGFIIDNVVELIVETDPNKYSVLKNTTFFFFKLLYFF